jgi:hypothetical protein
MGLSFQVTVLNELVDSIALDTETPISLTLPAVLNEFFDSIALDGGLNLFDSPGP